MIRCLVLDDRKSECYIKSEAGAVTGVVGGIISSVFGFIGNLIGLYRVTLFSEGMISIATASDTMLTAIFGAIFGAIYSN